jgi:hypothetical protein
LQEGQTGIVELKSTEGECPDLGDDDPQAVKLMIDSLYLEDYDPSLTPASGSSTPVESKDGCENIERTAEVAQTEDSFVGSAQPVEDMWGLNMKKTKKDKKGTNRTVAPPEPEPEPEPLLPVTTRARGDASSSFMEMHAKVFAIASKYDIKPLERIARQKLKA